MSKMLPRSSHLVNILLATALSNEAGPQLIRAMTLAKCGYAIFPLRENKRPYGNDDVAAVLGIAVPEAGQGGVKLATCEIDKVIKLWTAFSGARIGIATGAASGGLIVLDIDRKEGKDGFATLNTLGLALPPTANQETRSGGWHYLYRDRSGRHLPTDTNVPGQALDRRGDGGYIMDYGFDPTVPQPLAPEWLLAGSEHVTTGDRHPLGSAKLAAPSFADAARALNAHDPNDLSRDDWIKITSAFKQAVSTLVDENIARATWDIWCSNYSQNAPVENDRQWRSVQSTSSGWKALLEGSPARAEIMFGRKDGRQLPLRRSVDDILSDARKLAFDDTAAVEKLCAEAGTLSEIQKITVLRQIKDTTGIPISSLRKAAADSAADIEPDHLDIARKTIAAIGPENIIHAEQTTWKFEKSVWKPCHERELKQHVQRTLTDGNHPVTAMRVNGVSDVLKNDIYKPHHQFNRGNPESVNCLNGELELCNAHWQLMPHRRDLYRTTQIPVAYDPYAQAPMFWSFLLEIFRGDPDQKEKIDIVLEMMGYSLMSHAGREKFILLIGAGANGKSVLLAVLEALLGKDNVAGVQPANFDNRFQRGHLDQKLANIVTELKQGETIADAELKAITSGEPATVEHKGKDPFEIRPFATCWFGTNHMPHTRDYSDAFFRRSIVVEFNRVFQPHEQDVGLKLRLMVELPGILNYALWAYARVVSRNSFTIPASSLMAQRKWQLEANQVAQFVEACCTIGTDRKAAVEVLYSTYMAWARISGIRQTLGLITFGGRLGQLGYCRAKGTGGTREIKGLSVSG